MLHELVQAFLVGTARTIRHTIVGFDPDVYTVTMTLRGFSTFVQEGIEL